MPSRFREDSRRSFFSRTALVLGGLITGGLTIPAAIYLLIPSRRKYETEWVELGDPARLEPRVPEEVVFRYNKVDGWKVVSEKTSAWLVKLNDQEVVAYAPQCTHLGCAYAWDAQRGLFACPCHTSTFSVDGKCLGGPAPRNLDRYKMKIENSKVLISEIHAPIQGSKVG